MSEQAADIEAAKLAELGVLRAVEEIGFTFPDTLMNVHAGGVVLE